MKKLLLLLCSLALFAAGCSSSAPQSPAAETNNSTTQTSPEGEEAKPNSTPAFSAVKEEENTQEDARFEKWLNTYVISVCEEDYTTCHHYFEHPENYGIDISKCTITLGDFVSTPEEKQFFLDLKEELDGFAADQLNTTNRQILSQLKWQNGLQVRSMEDKYDYITNIWSSMNGVQVNLVTFFSEYQLYSQADIDPLIQLIHDVPGYVKLACDYSKKQAELGWLQTDLDALITSCKDVIDNRDDSPVTTELDAEIDSLLLDEAKAKDCKEQIHKALQESFFPAYQTIIDNMSELKDQIKGFSGMENKEGGKEYYEILLEYYSGLPVDIDKTMTELDAKMTDLMNTFKKLMDEDSKAASNGIYATTGFTKIDQIMPFLEEHYPEAFPLLDAMNYELKPLSKEQSTPGVLAYFVVPAIDSKRAYEIRYNNLDYGDDPSSFQLYDTFAHEGIPGHMYQTQYNHQNLKNTAQFFLTSMGFQEGYAVYAGRAAQKWLDLDPISLQAHDLNEEYTNYMTLMMDLQINGLGWSQKEFAKEYGDGLEPLYNQLAENPGVFFSYYYGAYQISKLHDQAKEALGEDFDDVAFNNALLKAGSVNFDIVKENVEAWIQSAKAKG